MIGARRIWSELAREFAAERAAKKERGK